MNVLQEKSRWLIIAILLVPISYSTQADSQAEFLDLLEYEIQNRVYAYSATQKAAESAENGPMKQYWQAYHALEQLNQERYQPIAEQYGISMEPTLKTRFKTRSSKLLLSLFPEYLFKKIHQATLVYIEKLKRLKALAQPEEHAFFEYAVQQEQAQADAFALVIDGKPEQAGALLMVFVEGHRLEGSR